MKINKSLLIILISMSTIGYSQVGVNTTEPTSTLDVNGTLRVRSMDSNDSSNARFIIGSDEDGNIINLELGGNVYIDGNVIRYRSENENIGEVEPYDDAEVDNVNLVILAWRD
ncbi:MAG: hypothetical protein ACI9Y7_001176 [Dokdonia sp.]|jgi:hypothetical protein